MKVTQSINKNTCTILLGIPTVLSSYPIDIIKIFLISRNSVKFRIPACVDSRNPPPFYQNS